MRFALFGTDAAAIAVVRGLSAFPEHELSRLVGSPETLAGVPILGPQPRYCRTWEELLSDTAIDAVAVTGDGDEKQHAVRQLVRAGKSVLLTPALTLPSSVFYELALIEAESPGTLFPLLGLRGHPLILKLRDLVLQNGLGRLSHVRLERKLAPSVVAADRQLSEDELARALLVDADLFRTLCGTYDQVTASRSGDDVHGY